ncbi:unnamed protein product [Caretta caretta]
MAAYGQGSVRQLAGLPHVLYLLCRGTPNISLQGDRPVPSPSSDKAQGPAGCVRRTQASIKAALIEVGQYPEVLSNHNCPHGQRELQVLSNIRLRWL